MALSNITLPNRQQQIQAVTSIVPYEKTHIDLHVIDEAVDIAILNDKYWDDFFFNKELPSSNDWLNSEKGKNELHGQSFEEWYSRKGLAFPSVKQNTIGIIPIGNFNIQMSFTK